MGARNFDALLRRREKARLLCQAKRDVRAANGLCTRCGERAPAADGLWCEPCREWARGYNKWLGATNRVLPGDRVEFLSGSHKTVKT